MKKILVVMKNEIVTILRRASFWLAALGVPLMGALVFTVVGVINRNSAATQTVIQVLTGTQEVRPEGYVDLSGVIQQIPASIPEGSLIAYPDEASARHALEVGEVSAFYIVPSDYIQEGEVTYIRPDFNPLASGGDQSSTFSGLLRVNLAGGDETFADLIRGPLNVEDTSLAASLQPDQKSPLAYWTPYIITILFYMLIMGSSSLLLGNISKEKENRTIETLLTSITPRQLLTGKILGLGIVGLGQTVFWLGTSFLLLNRSGGAFRLAADIHLPLSFLIWGLVFFLLGYAVYASLMAGLGALATNLREASQATFVIMLPMLVPLFFSSSVFMQEPNGPIATGLSLFPLSAPVAMMARLSAGGVPWWHPVLAAALLAATTVLIVRAVAGMFRAQTLLSGQAFELKRYFRALVGRA